ncbi:hypothetical protein GTZ99_03430 [Novosphingobium sp. FSY-8]|uniref:PilZ domain-containing protein n=1 Tax=Novosphingobium ovatum TaxID=1908523 RepID=A0ABW9XAP3_9SPHN|nr:PilZ domain-containing protein [Novosphingobium ovatum]NBC35603.1 hypothetical protein [Novosphingobium ovatum]
MTTGKQRREARTKVLIRARLRAGGPDHDACVMDASSHGMLVTCARPPARGEYVELRIAGDSYVGHVEWAGERRFGLTLYDPIDVTRLASGDYAPRPRARAMPVLASVAPVHAHRPDEDAERARQWGRRIEFGFVAGASMAASLLVAQIVADQLQVFQTVTTAIATGNAHAH